MRQEPTLALNATAVAGEPAVRPDDPMAWDNDADRVGAVGETDRANGCGMADSPGELPIGAGLAARDFAERPPHAELELGAAGRSYGQTINRPQVAGEIRCGPSALAVFDRSWIRPPRLRRPGA
jgi:hypothetical protein